ncbi:MAG: LysM peptidoglycan-binding domain-containing protein [Ardenticatenaceae bacterium]|nr:LysM peptidoglycan-binding domain-containing protein [Anaerolineales bacterium]MCB8985117.1 LysM peptidoglycan-binding domain-containing protein [Ardenticatenaceae bacterium]MCB8986658.1 LysM peptidoglycan-binding domain-containing protein [Ardenticatenaceae bacterium]
MRRLVLILFVLLLLAACSNNNQDSFTLPTSLTNGLDLEGDATVPPAAPRVEVTPTPPLPPTFTPVPMVHQGHLYLLPVSGADGTVQYVHIVRPGDTLTGLSKFYGVSADEVARVNHIKNQNLIEVGEPLVIPITAVP